MSTERLPTINESGTQHDSATKGCCSSAKESIHVMASIYKDSGYIIRELHGDPYSAQFKPPLYRLMLLRGLWLLAAILMELAVSFPFSWLMTALEHKQSIEKEFYPALRLYAVCICVSAPTLAIDHYLNELVYIRLREATTKILLHKYHENHNYFHISACDSVDNPGQRLDQDVNSWTFGVNAFATVAVRQLLRLVGWCAVLWIIGARLIMYSFALATLAVVLAVLIFASKLTHIAFLRSQFGADFRAGIIRTRDNGETIAFYDASGFENRHNMRRLALLLNCLFDQARWESALQLFGKVVRYSGNIVPLVLLAPAFIAGEMELGQLLQSAWAFTELLGALTLVISQMDRLSNIQAGGRRVVEVLRALEQIDERITHPPCIDGETVGSPRSVRSGRSTTTGTAMADPRAKRASQLRVQPGWHFDAGATATYRGILMQTFPLRAHVAEGTRGGGAEWLLLTNNLSIIVPGSTTLLLYKLNLEVAQHQNVLIVGPSGSGKSSLLRVLCGLWKWGEGDVTRLCNADVMFLPQRPYLPILGKRHNTLKNQLLFPKSYTHDRDREQHDPEQLTLREFYKTLELLNLEYILDYEEKADTEASGDRDSQDWSKLLSLGEQQRLSIGRVLIAKPCMCFLDEATSALDVDNQSRMYKLLREAHITYMSVGHRANLVEFHDTVLQIIGDGSWKLWDREEYVANQRSRTG